MKTNRWTIALRILAGIFALLWLINIVDVLNGGSASLSNIVVAYIITFLSFVDAAITLEVGSKDKDMVSYKVYDDGDRYNIVVDKEELRRWKS